MRSSPAGRQNYFGYSFNIDKNSSEYPEYFLASGYLSHNRENTTSLSFTYWRTFSLFLPLVYFSCTSSYTKLYSRFRTPEKEKKRLKAEIAELERIKQVEIPAMSIDDKSRQFNAEWRIALEVPNLWACAMATAQTALEHRATRLNHIRRELRARN